MLRACRRTLRPGGRVAYFTIFTTPGLSKRDHRRAVRLGPRAVASNRGQEELLEAAGFTEIGVTDVSPEFLATTRAWYDGAREREAALREAAGNALFDEQQQDRLDFIAAIEEGLLSRALLVASKERRPLDG